MSGLHQMTGAGVPFVIDGKQYRPKLKITMGLRGEIEAYILSKRPDFMDQISKSLKKFDPKFHKEIIAEAVRRSAMAAYVTNEEFDDYLHTFEGASLLFWVLVRDNHPEVDSPEAAQKILEKSEIDLAEIQAMLDRAAGLSDLKNSDGPTDPSDPAAGPQMAQQVQSPPDQETIVNHTISSSFGKAESPGPESIATSPASEAGTSIKSTG